MGPKNIGWGARGIWVRVDDIGINFLKRPIVTLTVVGADGQEPWSNVLMQGDSLELKNGAMGVSVRVEKLGAEPGSRHGARRFASLRGLVRRKNMSTKY